jgi:peptidoglycan/xylan/chitin deacetylase (PgdA/CDA1 family)
VVLTFDDGYLDNWAFAAPLLERYAFNGIVFVNPEFVGSEQTPRPSLKDVWAGRLSPEELPRTGFLSWPELAEMERAGVMDVQSHALSHTWYPRSGRIVDFRHPGDPYIWMTWNAHPGLKPRLQLDDPNLIELGEPVYEHGKSLEVRRVFPDENLRRKLVDFVRANGGAAFFTPGWRERLAGVVRDFYAGPLPPPRMESEEEALARVGDELEGSRRIIESRLSKKVEFLCWPGGGKTGPAVDLARRVGYRAWNYSSADAHAANFRNRPGENSEGFKRMGVSLYWNHKEGGAARSKYAGGADLLRLIRLFRGGRGALSMRILVGLKVRFAALGASRLFE